MDILGSYEEYGCQVNAISVDELFRRYQGAGFLYPDKMRRLEPFMPLIKENWTRLQRAGTTLHNVITCDLENSEGWASISIWQSTNHTSLAQHLVGTAGPEASKAVLLAGQAAMIRYSRCQVIENWFQRSNRFANKVFGSIEQSLEPATAWVGDYSYFFLPIRSLFSPDPSVWCGRFADSDRDAIRSLAARARSAVFCATESLDQDDVELNETDEMYRRVGLRRYRRVAVARLRSFDGVAGVASAYRGPLGLNFSFLENRCDLIVEPTLSQADQLAVIKSLLAAVAPCYADFELGLIPTTVDQRHAPLMRSLGAEHVRDYAQSAWVRAGFEAWYRHVDHIYDRVSRAQRRTGLARKRPAEIER